MAAAPLIVSTDIRNMTSAMKAILLNTEIIAVQQDALAKAGGIDDINMTMCMLIGNYTQGWLIRPCVALVMVHARCGHAL
jgi:hypothetical protein